MRERASLPIAAKAGANVKVVEVPPGPPVLSTLVAEVYGPRPQRPADFARQVHGVFNRLDGVVDTELMLTEGQPRTRSKWTATARRPRHRPAQAAAATMTLYGGQTVGNAARLGGK